MITTTTLTLCIDWKELGDEKATLINLLEENKTRTTTAMHLEGLLNFIDCIQDKAEEQGIKVK